MRQLLHTARPCTYRQCCAWHPKAVAAALRQWPQAITVRVQPQLLINVCTDRSCTNTTPRRRLVAAGVPDTAMLQDPATGLIKPLHAFLMADGWADDKSEVAVCAIRMEASGIMPLLPTGDGGYAVGDSCGRWPVDDSMRKRAQVRVCLPLRSNGLSTGICLLRVELGV